MRSIPCAPICSSTSSTAARCASRSSDEASITCRIRSAPVISSSVDLNASTKVVGSFWMKPTVSETVISRPSGSSNLRVVESSVANSLS